MNHFDSYKFIIYSNCGNQLNLWRNILESISTCKSLYVIWQKCLIPKNSILLFIGHIMKTSLATPEGISVGENIDTSSRTHFCVMGVKRTCLKELTRINMYLFLKLSECYRYWKRHFFHSCRYWMCNRLHSHWGL